MKTLLFKKLEKNRVRCGMCNHFCTIANNRIGLCGVRENREGELYSLVYPKIIARAVDPVEKKPLFHLLPGSTSFSIATAGCNFQCTFCQNSGISQIPQNPPNSESTSHFIPSFNPVFEVTPPKREIPGVDISPKTLVDQAKKAGCASISYTYTEPTIYFELAYETAKIARSQGLLNIFVTNGFMSQEALRIAAPFLDAANVDLKAFTDDFYRRWCNARIEPVKENLILMKSLDILVEVTTLLIPGLNDDPEEIKAMAKFIANELGVDTPWHISRFHPDYQMRDRGSTPVNTLIMAYETGKNQGLRYVYTGNAPGLDSENTFCHLCGAMLIRRHGYATQNFVTDSGACPSCNTKVYGIFQTTPA
ncbi:conserved hypothetical protein [Desulfamplus magnetovallimortis]|uniref:Radical SAM core domain-containing protein n=1 Tax=Desulfamplus magnetovallimortis TaxID=1246637 RepID=A0A1W1HFS2_9BACT|nr:AmmeMemoRadiSam system radical SAM enzyme [Desulfamplus magnetovallimortis]SLM31329.1 conserved hypothetical protein [Desulfamplus magnetovallimortis]